jgi:predicted negative regulator of RcsB-dependent stress response
MIYYRFLYYKKFYFCIAALLVIIFGISFFYYTNSSSKNDKLSLMLYNALVVNKSDENNILENIINEKFEPYSTIAKLRLANILYSQGSKDKALEIYTNVSSKAQFLNDIAKLNKNVVTGKFDNSNNLYYFSYKFFNALNQIENQDMQSAKQNLRDIQSAVDGNYYIKDLSSKVISSYDLN